eukprot:SAG11_NODE_1306_length_5245_cov_6.023513_7_plen_83_part_00
MSVRPYFGVVSAKEDTEVGFADERVSRVGWTWVKEKRDRKPVLNKAWRWLLAVATIHNSYIFARHPLIMTASRPQKLRSVVV